VQLAADEKVIFEGHPSWRSILGFYIKGLLLAAAAGAIAAGASQVSEDEVEVGWVVGAAIAVMAIVLVAGWIKRLITTYVITTRRLYIRRGIVARREQETHLDRVQNVNTSQSVLERMLAVGTVDFDTAAGDDYDFKFAGVASPQDVVEAVHVAQRQAAVDA
jgi:uncharacterized membrane protein YdbT with pleckstrin-like domain